jgi:ABC-type uncharacterized transport system permease subunit
MCKCKCNVLVYLRGSIAANVTRSGIKNEHGFQATKEINLHASLSLFAFLALKIGLVLSIMLRASFIDNASSKCNKTHGFQTLEAPPTH